VAKQWATHLPQPAPFDEEAPPAIAGALQGGLSATAMGHDPANEETAGPSPQHC